MHRGKSLPRIPIVRLVSTFLKHNHKHIPAWGLSPRVSALFQLALIIIHSIFWFREVIKYWQLHKSMHQIPTQQPLKRHKNIYSFCFWYFSRFWRYHIGHITVLKRMTLSYFTKNNTIGIMSLLCILRAYYFIDQIYVSNPSPHIYVCIHIHIYITEYWVYYFVNSISISVMNWTCKSKLCSWILFLFVNSSS